jgi:hypothetical protein
MKLEFRVDEYKKCCYVNIIPHNKYGDDVEIDPADNVDTIIEDTWSAALGRAIDRYSQWINHGEVEISITYEEYDDE